MTKFAPTLKISSETEILPKGKTITPKGYEWVLAFALRGCDWAIIEARKPEFVKMIRKDLLKQNKEALERLIQKRECELENLKKDLKESDSTMK